MYARVTAYRCDSSRLDDLTAKFIEIKAQVKAISGIVDVYSVWRADGNGVTVAFYESQADAEAAASQVQAIWASVADLLMEPPSAETYENVEHITA